MTKYFTLNRYINIKPIFQLILLFALWGCTQVFATPIYRYQDEAGRWHFTDKKPKQIHEEVQFKKSTKNTNLPELRWAQSDRVQILNSINPWYGPVQFELWQGHTRLTEWVVDARKSVIPLLDGKPISQWLDDYEYRYRLGRPTNTSDGQPLRPPVPDHGKYRVSQGFNGHFSHSNEPNQFAVDIAMNISDHVHAARKGIVVAVKDDYHMGGVDKFFLDKANYISVMHEDDTYAVYAHILLGSAVVREGQHVKAGEILANAGTSGYSTGPHLHFVLRANNGKDVISLPFKFSTNIGVMLPKEQTWLRVGQTAEE